MTMSGPGPTQSLLLDDLSSLIKSPSFLDLRKSNRPIWRNEDDDDDDDDDVDDFDDVDFNAILHAVDCGGGGVARPL